MTLMIVPSALQCFEYAQEDLCTSQDRACQWTEMSRRIDHTAFRRIPGVTHGCDRLSVVARAGGPADLSLPQRFCPRGGRRHRRRTRHPWSAGLRHIHRLPGIAALSPRP
ncbi:hypothetical protein [Streptomyces sp. NPDC001056]